MILAKSVIKDKFWILEENAQRVGMMNFKDNSYTINLKRKDYTINSQQELKTLGIEFVKRDYSHGGHLEVLGYPTDQEEVFNVQEIDGYPTFTKKAASKSTHVAGWYGIRFKNGWVCTLCPRLTTIKTNKHVGPYRTKMDLKVVLNQKRDGEVLEDEA
jgi:hypothetical protein